MSILANFLIFDECYFIIVSILVILVNKYVLSVLQFTIPTVFQGWQTLVCVVILTGLARWKKLKLEVEVYDKRTSLSLVFPLLCYTLFIVAGSKALAELPVPIFLSGSNLTPASLTLLESIGDPPGTLRLATSFTILCSTTFLFAVTRSTSTQLAWAWLVIHIVAGVLHTKSLIFLHIPGLNAVTLIYHRNFFSILILLPLSIFLEEAAHAFHYHNQLASINFYFGCALSGVLGTWLQFLSGHLEYSNRFPALLGYSKLMCTISAWYFFTHDLNLLAWCLIFINLLAGTLGLSSDACRKHDDTQKKAVIDV